jgi:hypothetical protein
MTDIKANAWAICDRVAEAQALLHDHLEGGRFTADGDSAEVGRTDERGRLAAGDVGGWLFSARHSTTDYNRGELVNNPLPSIQGPPRRARPTLLIADVGSEPKRGDRFSSHCLRNCTGCRPAYSYKCGYESCCSVARVVLLSCFSRRSPASK